MRERSEWTPVRHAKLRRLWSDETLSVKQIAESMGVSPQAISQERIRLGLPSRYPRRFAARPQG